MKKPLQKDRYKRVRYYGHLLLLKRNTGSTGWLGTTKLKNHGLLNVKANTMDKVLSGLKECIDNIIKYDPSVSSTAQIWGKLVKH